MRHILEQVARCDFKDRLWTLTRKFHEIEQSFGFDAFERSARYCLNRLRESGVDEPELLEFPADGRTAFWDKVMPPAWNAEGARLQILSPQSVFEDPIIADTARHRFHLAMWSAATPPGGVVTEVVTEGMMLAGHSLQGRLVLPEAHRNPRELFRLVADLGGAGIVSDYVADPGATPDGLFWANSFGEGPGWFPLARARNLLGFCISPRAGQKLRTLIAKGAAVVARAEVNARTAPGSLFAVTGRIRGQSKPNEEIWMVAHLCEPLGTDNAPGAAASIVVASVLRQLIRRGQIPAPARSIRFVFSLESYGTQAVCKTLLERGKTIAATFVVDSVAARQDRTGRPIQVFLSPVCNPLFSDKYVMDAARRCLNSRSDIWAALNGRSASPAPVRYDFKPGYLGNDAFLGDPMLGGPSFHLLADEGAYWHNSRNTLDLVWRELLNVMVPLHAEWAYALADAGPRDAARLGRTVAREAKQGLQRAARQETLTETSPGALHHEHEVIRRRIDNLARWTDMSLESREALRNRVRVEFEKCSSWLARASRPSRRQRRRVPGRTDRMARAVVFKRTQPGFPMSQCFAGVSEPPRALAGIAQVLGFVDGRRNLFDILEETAHFAAEPLNRDALLSDCLFLAQRGYLNARVRSAATTAGLVAALRKAGVRRGDLIFVHASLSALGHVQGGAEACVDALLESVGPRGTVMMPAFTQSFLWCEGRPARNLDRYPYHPRQAHCCTGAISEAFLRRANFLRSDHPSHSVAAIGPLARECLRHQRRTDPPMAATSPLARLAAFSGKIVYLGAPFIFSTFLHYLETKMSLPYLTDALCYVRGEDGDLDVVHVPQNLAGHRDFYAPDWRQTKMFRALIGAGLKIRSARAGMGEVRVIHARELARLGLAALRRTPDILLCDSQDCLFCAQARQKVLALRKSPMGANH